MFRCIHCMIIYEITQWYINMHILNTIRLDITIIDLLRDFTTAMILYMLHGTRALNILTEEPTFYHNDLVDHTTTNRLIL